jgi:D-3-phosphoglycerate dehydrogenase
MTLPQILAVGDRFVLPELFVAALHAELGDHADVTSYATAWPDEPETPIAEVDEASGSEQELIEALQGRNVLVTHLSPITRTVLEACPDLELVVVARGGPVNVNVAAATENGVRICYAPGRNATATAEMGVTLLLSVLRSIPIAHAQTLSGVGRGALYRYAQAGPEVENTTIGLVGYGAVGSRVARVLHALGADVRVFDPYVDAATLAGIATKMDSLDDLLRASRVVSLHTRLTPETQGLIGRREISLMPQGSYLVNSARGGLLDYDALGDALEEGHLLGAAMDVYPEEPLPSGHRLTGLAEKGLNVVMTPHVAGASRSVAEKVAGIVAAEVGRYARGEALSHLSNPDVLIRLADQS